MDVRKLSTSAIKTLLAAIGRASESDRKNPGRTDPWYGVAEDSGWAEQRDEFEAELLARGEHFDPVRW